VTGAVKRRPFRETALAVGMLATSTFGAVAQSIAAAGAGAHLEVYRFASPVAGTAKSASVLTAPFAARLAFAYGLTFDVSGAVARAVVNFEDGSSASLSGLTDTQVGLTKRIDMAGTALELSAIGLVPTGHATLALTETLVAGLVASDILPFRISNWGTGGGAIIDLSAVRPTETGSVGVAASYRLARDFQPFHTVPVHYRPGDELRLRLAVDRSFEGARVLAVQIAYSRFGEDQWSGIGLLRSGARVLALGSYAVPVGSGYGSAYIGVLHRSGGGLGESVWLRALLSGIVAPPSETLVVLGSAARVPWRDRLLLPAFDLRVLRHSAGGGPEMLLGIGGSAELPIGDAGARLVPTARLRVGRVRMATDAKSAVYGLELGLGLRFGRDG